MKRIEWYSTVGQVPIQIKESTRNNWIKDIAAKIPKGEIKYITSGDSIVMAHHHEDGIEVYDARIRRNGFIDIPKTKVNSSTKNKNIFLIGELEDFQDLWVMLLSTIRYSLGRSTYMPGYCIDLYKDYGSFLQRSQRQQIADEIKQAIELAVSCNKTVGMKCDHETWLNFISIIEKDIVNVIQL